MLSYKNWKLINESYMPGINLGVSTPQSISAFKSFYDETKKKMLLDPDEVDDELDVAPEDEEGLGDEDLEDKDLEGLEDEDLEGLGDEEMGDEEMGDEEMGDEMGGEEMGEMPPPPMPKRRRPPQMEAKKNGRMGKKSMIACPPEDKDKDMDLQILGKKADVSEAAQALKKEADREFWSSLKNQIGMPESNTRHWSGLDRKDEDALYALANIDTSGADGDIEAVVEPGPGEVGFAPQTRFGLNAPNSEYLDVDTFPSVADYTEWKLNEGKKPGINRAIFSALKSCIAKGMGYEECKNHLKSKMGWDLSMTDWKEAGGGNDD